MKPLAIDLFCGLGGWTEGLLAEGYEVVGFDIERHDYGDGNRYPAQLVIQDVTTLHGRQFKDAALIVASPPCQEYSYMAMPWSKAKAIAAEYREGKRDTKKLTALFDACFRIQREAIEAAGRPIPLVVENVRGAIPWVGRSRWNFGSFHLWGDVPALMPMVSRRQPMNQGITHRQNGETSFHKDAAIKNNGGSWFNIGSPGQKVVGQNPDGRKVPTDGAGRRTDIGNCARFTSRDCGMEATGFKSQGMNWSNQELRGQDFTRIAGKQAMAGEATKIGGDWFSDPNSTCRRHWSTSIGRKQASAAIAKIPFPLARHIAWAWRPR